MIGIEEGDGNGKSRDKEEEDDEGVAEAIVGDETTEVDSQFGFGDGVSREWCRLGAIDGARQSLWFGDGGLRLRHGFIPLVVLHCAG